MKMLVIDCVHPTSATVDDIYLKIDFVSNIMFRRINYLGCYS